MFPSGKYPGGRLPPMNSSCAPRHRILLALLLVASSSSAEPNPLDAPTKQWRHGPVRYLLTKAEDQAYRKLEDPAARAAFIASFWKRRDPTPATEENEFYQEFWDRVERTESLRLYFESTKPMWLTDPGKWYILLGPPNEEQREQVATSTRDTVTWTYRRVPGVTETNFVLVFAADEGGEMRLSQTPALDQSPVQGLAPSTPPAVQGSGLSRAPQANPLLAQMFSEADASLGAIGAQTQTSALHRLIAAGDRGTTHVDGQTTAEVRTETSFDTFPIDVRVDFYRAADGTTYSAFTLAPSPPPDGDLVPFGGIISLDDERVTYSLSRPDQFAAAGTAAPGTFQTGLGLDPGRYRLFIGLQRPGSARMGRWKQDLTVPDLSGPGLGLSSLTLARRLDRLAGAAPDGSLKVPFVLGSFRVVPRADAALRNGDDFNLYYQVYGAERPPEGSAEMDVRYRFDGWTEGAWIPIGDPIAQEGLTGEAQAWSFPIRGWPPGRFRLTVTVVDRHSGRTAMSSLEFAVVG